MTAIGWLQAVIFFLIVLALTKPIGLYMVRVFEGERTWLSPVLRPLETLIYRLGGVRENEEMPWYAYALSMLAFSVIGLVYLYVLLRTQKWLPFNPQHFDNMAPDLAWNTAVSFLTNTNWQFYSGESTMSYLSQMAGLAWHNFVSAAVGIAIAVAVVRGLVRTNVKTLGNFWVDLTRCSLYVLLPVSIVVGLFFVSQGVPQNFPRLPRRQVARRLHAVDHRRPDGVPRSHQRARHERRRIRQRELRVAQRKPESADQLRRDAADILPRRRPDVHVRQDGRKTRDKAGRSSPQWLSSFSSALGRRIGPKRPAIRIVHQLGRRRREYGGQGVPVRGRGFGALRHRHDRHVVRRRQRDARLASCRSAASSRWSTCNSARSSSAASAAASTG